MENEDELKEIDIRNRTCFYFDDIIRARNRDICSTDLLLDEKLYKENLENILIYDISHKTSTGAKPLRLIKQMDLLRFIIELDI